MDGKGSLTEDGKPSRSLLLYFYAKLSNWLTMEGILYEPHYE